MQTILRVIFAIFSGFVTVFSAGLGDSTCKSIRPIRNLNEIRNQGVWLVYGGSVRCDDCCTTYDLILKKPGLFVARITNHTLSGPGKPVEYNCNRIRPGSYKLDSNYGTVHVLSTDYTSYHVVYIQPGRLILYIRSLEVLKDKCTRDKVLAAFKKQSRICGRKYYPYNIEKACRKYKPTD